METESPRFNINGGCEFDRDVVKDVRPRPSGQTGLWQQNGSCYIGCPEAPLEAPVAPQAAVCNSWPRLRMEASAVEDNLSRKGGKRREKARIETFLIHRSVSMC